MVNPAKLNEKIQIRNINKTKIIFRTGDLVINTKMTMKQLKQIIIINVLKLKAHLYLIIMTMLLLLMGRQE